MATNKFLVAIGSFIGGFSSLIIFLDVEYQMASFFIKLLIAAVIVTISFLPRSIKAFIKLYGVFFTVSLIFGGTMFFLEITINPEKIMYYNGTVYFDMSLAYLVGSVLVIYGFFLLVQYFLDKKACEGSLCELKVFFRNTSVSLFSIIDTGNNLTDGLTGRPVAVAELSAVAPLFDFRELEFLKKGCYENIPDSLKKYIRIVPCDSVTGAGVLLAIVPEKIELKTKTRLYINDYCVVAVLNKRLSDGEYRALINEKILLNSREEKCIEGNAF
jgi:stage II sporulation protein GA (sporulation sigma-E factor processing peptidase)